MIVLKEIEAGKQIEALMRPYKTPWSHSSKVIPPFLFFLGFLPVDRGRSSPSSRAFPSEPRMPVDACSSIDPYMEDDAAAGAVLGLVLDMYNFIKACTRVVTSRMWFI
jgi:hypothetical protein